MPKRTVRWIELVSLVAVLLATECQTDTDIEGVNSEHTASPTMAPSRVVQPTPTKGGSITPVSMEETPSHEPASSEDRGVTIASPEVPPRDVLQQIAYYAAGGGVTADSDDCEYYCFKAYEDKIIIRDYEPRQSLRVLVYVPTSVEDEGAPYLGVSRYVTEWVVSVDEHGYLELEVQGEPADSYDYIVLDAESNEVIRVIGQNYSSPVVPGGGFTKGSRVRAKSGSDRLNIRATPDYGAEVVGQVSHDGRMTITGSPRIENKERWWPIETDNGVKGWVTELWISPVP